MDKLSIRFGRKEDEPSLVNFFSEPGVLRWFPMCNQPEVQDSARVWFTYAPTKAVLTAVWDGIVCGTAVLYISPYQKTKHQCLFAIIVDQKYRGKGVGSRLLEELLHQAKARFSISLIHLEVYRGNPALSLYKRLGFTEYGCHKNYLKEADGTYLDKILMQKTL